MEESNKKILTLGFVCAGLLTGYVLSVLLEASAATFGFMAKLLNNDLLMHGLPVVLGFATFTALQFNKRSLVYFDEVVVEVKKVVWPSQKDTSAMTIVVVVMLILSGVVLGTFDIVSGYFINMFIR